MFVTSTYSTHNILFYAYANDTVLENKRYWVEKMLLLSLAVENFVGKGLVNTIAPIIYGYFILQTPEKKWYLNLNSTDINLAIYPSEVDKIKYQ